MIYPNKLDLSKLRQFYRKGLTGEELINSLNEAFAEDKIILMHWEDFLNFFKQEGLDEKYPMPPNSMLPYAMADFGAYFPEFEEMIFVVDKRNFGDYFQTSKKYKELKHNFHKIFSHENIHMKQYAQKSKSDTWHGQTNTDDLQGKDAYAAYLKEPDEFMAFANSIAHEIYNFFGEKGMLLLNDKWKLRRFSRSYGDYARILNTKEMRKFNKYIFLYLEDIIQQNES